MKIKYAVSVLMLSFSLLGHTQENDDMYFNINDRQQESIAQMTVAKKNQVEDQKAVEINSVVSAGNYLGRGVNPEFRIQKKNVSPEVQGKKAFFVPNYQSKNTNNYSNSVNQQNFNNNYYSRNHYGIFNSGYGYYSPYSNLFYTPCRSTFGISPAAHMGWFGNSVFCNSYSYGSYYYAQPVQAMYHNQDANIVLQRHHRSRSTSLNNEVSNGGRQPNIMRSTNVDDNIGGRLQDKNASPNYYDRGWRNNNDNFNNPPLRTPNNIDQHNSNWDTGTSRSENGRSTFDTGRNDGNGADTSSGGGGRSRGR